MDSERVPGVARCLERGGHRAFAHARRLKGRSSVWGSRSVKSPPFVRTAEEKVHELGIVYHIIRDVENVARANGVSRVSSVTLLLGEVSGVVPDLLLDAWRWAADKKPITQGAELIVEPVEAVTHCEACGCDYATVEHGKTCPHCGSGETYLLQGQEVMIKQIETPDEDPADTAPGDLSDAPDAVDAANPLHIA